MEEFKSKLSLKQQKIACWTNRFLPIVPLVFFVVFLLINSVLSADQLTVIFNLKISVRGVQDIKKFLIMFCSFGFFFNLLYLISAWLADYQKYQQYRMQFLFLSICGFGVLQLANNIFFYSYDHQKNIVPNKMYKKIFLKKLGIWKWSTYEVALIGIFVGLTIVLAYISQFLPSLQNGGGVSLKYIPIIIIAFIHSSLAGVFVGAISALVSLVFIPNSMIVSPWSYLLDYFLPMISPSIAGLLTFKVGKQKHYLEYLNYVIVVVSVFLLVYLWQTLAGYFFWVAIYGPGWGNNGLIYSIVYNAIQVWIFTYPLTQILIPPILKVLTPLYGQKNGFY